MDSNLQHMIRNAEGARTCIKIFFDKLFDSKQTGNELMQQIQQLHEDLKQVNEIV